MSSVREYLEKSKNALYEAYMKNPTISTVYEMTKYCKVPVLEGGKPAYVNLRPQDLVEIITCTKNDKRVVKSIRFVCHHNLNIVDTKFQPKWNTPKVDRWIDANTTPASALDIVTRL
jgi:hypothetical protein